MELNVVFKDMDPEPAVTERLESKLQRLEERLGKPIAAKAVLIQHKNEVDCQIRLPYYKKRELVAAATGRDWTSAVDEATEKVERQLNRAEEQRQGRRDGKSLREVPNLEPLASEPEVAPLVEVEFVSRVLD